ncbi:LuxR C-terminal-related transcriptional regulator [Paenibacillus sp. FJAT-26967]|uniref:LuxR C-terminal-related transcriptional regulator n=1 Tax=Paenibacillus sp. FJAT-26967 TaxID=1729690 RepID=UPI0009FE2C98|nr:LuxR C-terminal-related transcriptional regulator [Paenibacillus sp. FJAT-26967]
MIHSSESIILRTKTSIPALKPNWVKRRRLVEVLEKGATGRLTTLCAPAGSGKTTLLAQWIHSSGCRSSWCSLDSRDNDPLRFWRYVCHAITDAASPAASVRILELSQALPGLSLPVFLDAVLNELSAMDERLILVIDDYQVIREDSIHANMAYFIDYLPDSVHMILSSRNEIPFSTVKWISRGECTEINAGEIPFTLEETFDFYHHSSDLPLKTEHLQKLFHRTEGWVTGLQLLAISLRSQTDVDLFIEQFTGNHRNVADYLFHEVLGGLPEDILEFVLQTSLMERMDADLCDAVTGRGNSQSILDKLRNWNIFLVPLDNDQVWFRYHHLFAQFARSFMKRKKPGNMQGLNRHISECYARRGLLDEAIEYAIAAEDYSLADRLLAQHLPDVLQRGEIVSLLRWFDSVPSRIVRTPEMRLLHGFILLAAGKLDRSESVLKTVEADHENMEPSERRRLIQSGLLFMKSNLLFYSGEYEAWYRFADGIKDRFLPESPLFYGFNYNRREPFVRRTEFGLKGVLSSDTEVIGLRFVQVLESKGWKDTLITLYMNQTLAEGYYELNRLQESHALLLKVDRSSATGQIPGLSVPNRLMQARLYKARGQHRLAHETIEHAIESVVKQHLSESHWLHYLRAYQIRLYLMEGKVLQAKELAGLLPGFSPQDKPALHQEYVYGTLARLLGAQHRESEALHLLDLLKPQAAREGQLTVRMEITLLQALFEAERGQTATALGYLHEALRMGEANGYIRSFVDEGAAIGELLRKYRDQRISACNSQAGLCPEAAGDEVSLVYVDMLLDIFMPQTAAAPAQSRLIEPLTRSEASLLKLLARGASNKEIAQELTLSIGTVKVYLSRIYAKLGVTSRTQALIAARELELKTAD